MAKYSAWGDDDGPNLFVGGDVLPDKLRVVHESIGENLRLLRVFEAESWNDAARQYHEWAGWEPYVPSPETEGLK